MLALQGKADWDGAVGGNIDKAYWHKRFPVLHNMALLSISRMSSG